MDTQESPFKGLRTVAYFVDDLEKAKDWYSRVLKIKPYFDELFYVGFNVAGYELGLQPKEDNKDKPGNTIATYWAVDDIDSEFKRILDLGAEIHEEPKDVGGGLKVASLFDPWGNLLGIIYNPFFKNLPNENSEQPKVTGLGGVFFKSENPEKLYAWYKDKLGIEADKYGTSFEWGKIGEKGNGYTAWSIMDKKTKYFNPGKNNKQEFMINYRVDNLNKLIEDLRSAGVKIEGEIEKFEYGSFGWILDLDGNKVELWEPNDLYYEEILEQKVKSK